MTEYDQLRAQYDRLVAKEAADIGELELLRKLEAAVRRLHPLDQTLQVNTLLSDLETLRKGGEPT